MRAAPRFDAERTDRIGVVGALVKVPSVVMADTGRWPRDRRFPFIMGTASLLWVAMYGFPLTFI